MKYCDDCANKRKLPISPNPITGRCDICNETTWLTEKKGIVKENFQRTGVTDIDNIIEDQMKGKPDFAKRNIREFAEVINKISKSEKWR